MAKRQGYHSIFTSKLEPPQKPERGSKTTGYKSKLCKFLPDGCNSLAQKTYIPRLTLTHTVAPPVYDDIQSIK